MRHYLWSVLAATTLLSGCDSPSEIKIRTTVSSSDQGVLRVIDGLQCPESESVLTRKGSASADGRSCHYVGPRGTEVELRLVRLDNRSAEAALKLIEDELPGKGVEPLQPLKPLKPIEPMSGSSKHTTVEFPGLRVEENGERSTVRLPGMKIESDGDRSEVRIGGLVIRSDGKSDNSRVHISGTDGKTGSVTVNSNETVTHVNTLSQKDAIRASYRRITSEVPATSEWRSVGYEARGPMGGPMVVAIVRSRANNDDRVFNAAKDLVTLNVGK
jgi:hypothetical protein